jgi:hypothetical protein
MAEVRNSEVTAYKMKVTWVHVYLNNNNNNNNNNNSEIMMMMMMMIIIIIRK